MSNPFHHINDHKEPVLKKQKIFSHLNASFPHNQLTVVCLQWALMFMCT